MRRALLIAGLALLVAWSTEASANLIVNGDFETNTLAPWTASGDVTIDSSQPHSGTFNSAFFGSNGSLSQSVPTIGTNFTLSFWLNNGSTDPFGSSSFSVSFGGSQVASFGNLDNFGAGYFLTTLSVSTATALTQLSFLGSNDSGNWYLDDISLNPVAVPEPPSISILGGALALLFGVYLMGAPRLRVSRKRVA
jgi:chitinase